MPVIRPYLLRMLWPAASSRELAARLPEYLDANVRARLAMSAAPLRLERIETGSNTLVHRWRLPSGRCCFVRAWPSDPREYPAREHAEVSALFEGAGLRVPRILFTDSSFQTMRKWRMEILVEDEAEGRPLLGESGETWRLEALALDLARMHSVAGTEWGKPWRPVNEGRNPPKYWRERVARFRKRITPATSGLDPGLIALGLARLEKLSRALVLDRPVLVHNDINPANLFLNESGGLTWIDFGTVEYGVPEQDLMKVRYVLESEDAFARFMGYYQGFQPAPRPIHPENLEGFAHLFLWERINSRVKRSARRIERGRADETESLRREQRKIEEQLRQMIEGGATVPDRLIGKPPEKRTWIGS